MGLLRLANPLCANVSPPRKRTARAAEAIARDLRAALAETTAAAIAAEPAAITADVPVVAAPAVRWSDDHAAAIMRAYRAGDRAGVEAAIVAAQASIEVSA
jgi:hypothetical protein